MKMQKRRFRIGDLSKRLNVDKFVIRFWEKEFSLHSDRSEGGQRFYEEKDFETFKEIKNLLYEKKFTIAGAKKQIQNSYENTKIIASQKINLANTEEIKKTKKLDTNIIKKIIHLKKNLTKLKKLLQ
ncbi:MerR family transcriptional regulator [Candidatus Dependentiae bacterium]